GLEIDASEYMVCSQAGIRFSRSAQPKPSSQRNWPSRATATAADATFSLTMRWRMNSRTAPKSGVVLLLADLAVSCPAECAGRHKNAAPTAKATANGTRLGCKTKDAIVGPSGREG